MFFTLVTFSVVHFIFFFNAGNPQVAQRDGRRPILGFEGQAGGGSGYLDEALCVAGGLDQKIIQDLFQLKKFDDSMSVGPALPLHLSTLQQCL